MLIQFEAVPESLKNVLLVMNASGFLLPPFENRNAEQVLLWDSTFERILPFLPNLKDDLFPEPKRAIPFVAVETEKVIEELEQEKATKVEE